MPIIKMFLKPRWRVPPEKNPQINRTTEQRQVWFGYLWGRVADAVGAAWSWTRANSLQGPQSPVSFLQLNTKELAHDRQETLRHVILIPGDAG